MQWTESIETYIKNKGNECGDISLMHEAEADRNHNINRILTYFGISISFLMALFQIPNIIIEEEHENKTNLWSFLTLSAFAVQTSIATIIQTGNFTDKKDLNLISSLDFEIMKSNIMQQLAIDSANRRPANEYQKYIDDLFIKASRYRPYVSEKNRKKFTTCDVLLSLSADDVSVPVLAPVSSPSTPGQSISETVKDEVKDMEKGEVKDTNNNMERNENSTAVFVYDPTARLNLDTRSKNLLKEMNKRYRTQNFNSNAAGDDSSYNDWQLKRFMNQ